ncbi:hypothetical protein SAMN02910456_00142 [Ruminococcaceae bacterium YRB3002]|nr:hypothetical protein SAMN02910456_00142 [Ruminococcaceae bacterium YRB3002]
MRQESFWDILGISPTTDKKEIKSAFAKLAHTVSPEEDPDGYMRIHDAYKEALFYAGRDMIDSPSDDLEESIEDPGNSGDDPDYDFSSVKTDKEFSHSASEMMDEIVEFKEINRLNSASDVSRQKDIVLARLANELFELYAGLAEFTDDTAVWDAFFSEPAVNIMMDNRAYKVRITERFEFDSKHRAAIEDHLEVYNRHTDRLNGVHAKQYEYEQRNRNLKQLWGIAAGISFFLTPLSIAGQAFFDIPLGMCFAFGSFFGALLSYCMSRFLDRLLCPGVVSISDGGFVVEEPQNFVRIGMVFFTVLNAAYFVIMLISLGEFSTGSLIITASGGLLLTLMDVLLWKKTKRDGLPRDIR